MIAYTVAGPSDDGGGRCGGDVERSCNVSEST